MIAVVKESDGMNWTRMKVTNGWNQGTVQSGVKEHADERDLREKENHEGLVARGQE